MAFNLAHEHLIDLSYLDGDCNFAQPFTFRMIHYLRFSFVSTAKNLKYLYPEQLRKAFPPRAMGRYCLFNISHAR